MAKAINWPLAFRQEVLAEDSETRRCALRLGSLYHTHQYWVPGEVVDIRVNHLRVRKATIDGELKKCLLSELTPEDYQCLKSPLKTLPAVIEFLKNTYNQPAEESTEITVVYYINHPVIMEEVE